MAIRRRKGGRTDAASEFNYLQINQRLLECRQISQVNSAAAAATARLGRLLNPTELDTFPTSRGGEAMNGMADLSLTRYAMFSRCAT